MLPYQPAKLQLNELLNKTDEHAAESDYTFASAQAAKKPSLEASTSNSRSLPRARSIFPHSRHPM